MTYDIELTLREELRLFLGVIGRSKWLLCAYLSPFLFFVFMLVQSILEHDAFGIRTAAALVLLFGVVYVCIPILTVAWTRSSRKGRLHRYAFEVSKDGIARRNSLCEVKVKWSQVRRVKRTKHFVLFFFGINGVQAIPIRMFSSQEQVAALLAFCETHLKGTVA